jgi:hypothetical protein
MPPTPLKLDGEVVARDSAAIMPPAIDNLWQLNITQLTPDGRPVKQGDVVVSFDGGETQKQLLEKAQRAQGKADPARQAAPGPRRTRTHRAPRHGRATGQAGESAAQGNAAGRPAAPRRLPEAGNRARTDAGADAIGRAPRGGRGAAAPARIAPAAVGDRPARCRREAIAGGVGGAQRHRPARRRDVVLRAQEKGTKEKGTRLWRRASSGALRCSPSSGRRELAHPCARTCAPFPRARLRCSAPETGGRASKARMPWLCVP